MRNVEEEEEEGEEWPGERNAHNAVISVFDLPISLWGYYVGTLYGARACVRVGEGGGRFYFTRIIIPLEDRAPIPPRRGESRALSVNRTRLFMDGFSFNFRQGPRPPLVSLTLVFLPPAPLPSPPPPPSLPPSPFSCCRCSSCSFDVLRPRSLLAIETQPLRPLVAAYRESFSPAESPPRFSRIYSRIDNTPRDIIRFSVSLYTEKSECISFPFLLLR